MDKDEILARAQREGSKGTDDGSVRVRNRGLRYGVTAVYALCGLYFILAMFKDGSVPFIAQSMFMALIAGDAFSRWEDTHTVGSMCLLILAVVATIMTAVAGVGQLFGKW